MNELITIGLFSIIGLIAYPIVTHWGEIVQEIKGFIKWHFDY